MSVKSAKMMNGSKLFDVVIYLFLTVLCIAILYPLYYMAIISISDGGAVMRGEVNLWPKGVTLETYKVILSEPSLLSAYGNTLLYTSTGTLIALFLTAICAYPLSRKKFYGRTIFTFIIIFTLFFDGGMIPKYLVINELGIMNTMWAIVLPPAINVWYMIIMRTFFQNIPESLHESAYIDGANDLKVFYKIVLPLSTPVIATMFLFYAVWHWNSFFPALLYLHESAKYPLQILLRNIVISGDMSSQMNAAGAADTVAHITGTNIKYAVIYITILPIILVYPFVQKYFVKGIMIGSLKG